MSDWKTILLYVISFLLVEILAYFTFSELRKKFNVEVTAKKHYSVLKGILERSVVYIGLILSVQSIVIVFGTLKIATRIKSNEEDEKISSDYFLTGNFLSLLFVFAALLFYKLLNLIFNIV